MKLLALVIVTPLTVTEIGPVVAPTGTTTIIVVAVAELTEAVVPLNLTTFSAGALLKLEPVIVTVAPIAPLVGEKLINNGVCNTVKTEVLVTVSPFTVIEIAPVVAPAGTVVVMLVAVEAVTIASVPLNLTMLLLAVVL